MVDVLSLVVLAATFLGGLVAVPAFVYLTVGVLPGFIAAPLASGLFALGNLGAETMVLFQTENDGYELRPASEVPAEIEPRYWTRFGLTDFAIDCATTAAAFGPDSQPADEVAELHREPDNRLSSTAEGRVDGGKRGAGRTYVPLDVEGTVVRALNVLARLGGAPGERTMQKTSSAGEKRHGGDTGDFGPLTTLAGYIVFAGLGLTMAVVIFGAPALGV